MRRLLLSISLLLLGSTAAPAYDASLKTHPSSISQTAGAVIRILAAGGRTPSREFAETEPAWKTLQNDMAEDLFLQVDAPLQAFGNAMSESWERREVAAKLAVATIIKSATAQCRLDGVRDFVVDIDRFLGSASRKDAEAHAAAIRRDLEKRGTFFRISFPSSTPPDPTDRILPLIAATGDKISALSATYGRACSEVSQPKEAALQPASYQESVLELSRTNEALSLHVKMLVDDLQRQVSALDEPMVDWAIHSLKSAQPQRHPGAYE